MVQVNNNTPINLRIKFKKVGKLQYISHLDLVRTMNKIIVRSGLPLWYTEGFNPKPKMVFAAPLSIGTESMAEFVDIRLSRMISEELAFRCLNENMTDEMQALEVYYPERKLTELAWLSYTISIKTAGANEALANKCEQVLLAPHVEVEKKMKGGDRAVVDIRNLIKSASAALSGEYIRVSCVLSASPSAFLNPEYIVKALKNGCGILSDPVLTNEYYSIMRDAAYLADMTEFK
jgi:radical SAM-linked protein